MYFISLFLLLGTCRINGQSKEVEYCVGHAGYSGEYPELRPHRMMLFTDRNTSNPEWNDWRYRLCFKVNNSLIADNGPIMSPPKCPLSQTVFNVYKTIGERARVLVKSGSVDYDPRALTRFFSFCAKKVDLIPCKSGLTRYCIGSAGTTFFQRPDMNLQDLKRHMIFEGDAGKSGWIQEECFCAVSS